jgi:hypothetical protein
MAKKKEKRQNSRISRERLFSFLRFSHSLKFPVSETMHQMIIDQAHGLHKTVADRRPHEQKAPLPQIFAHGL